MNKELQTLEQNYKKLLLTISCVKISYNFAGHYHGAQHVYMNVEKLHSLAHSTVFFLFEWKGEHPRSNPPFFLQIIAHVYQ